MSSPDPIHPDGGYAVAVSRPSIFARRATCLRFATMTTFCAAMAMSASVSAGSTRRVQVGPRYAQARVAGCLARHGVSEQSDIGFTVAKPSYRKLFPPGITGSISVPAPLGTSSRFDHALLYFFSTSSLAEAGKARLVSTYVYARGVPLAIALVLDSHGIPPARSAPKLVRVTGNLVVLWEYPRRHSAASDRLLNLCLATSQGRPSAS